MLPGDQLLSINGIDVLALDFSKVGAAPRSFPVMHAPDVLARALGIEICSFEILPVALRRPEPIGELKHPPIACLTNWDFCSFFVVNTFQSG